MESFFWHLVSELYGYLRHWHSIWYVFFVQYLLTKSFSIEFSLWFFLKDFDIKLFQPTVANILIIVWLFIYCFYGHLISWKCQQIGDFTYHSLFYKYPLDLRMFTLFMITRSQRPFYITGYKLTKCSLDSYARVGIKSIIFFSHFFNKKKPICCFSVHAKSSFNLHTFSEPIKINPIRTYQ